MAVRVYELHTKLTVSHHHLRPDWAAGDSFIGAAALPQNILPGSHSDWDSSSGTYRI